jgi:ABC-type dipeptide/oligopeptide/nickel transport system permease subunit
VICSPPEQPLFLLGSDALGLDVWARLLHGGPPVARNCGGGDDRHAVDWRAAALLVSTSVLAEATLSYAGFGFLEPSASWGTMLHDVGSVYVLSEFPWLFAPAVAIASVSMAVRAIAEQPWTRTERIWLF